MMERQIINGWPYIFNDDVGDWEFDVAAAHFMAKERVCAYADEIANAPAIAGLYPKAERDSWAVKLAAAEAVTGGTATQNQQDMLAAEAADIGLAVDELAAAIIKKAGWFSKLAARIAGLRQKAFAGIDAASSEEEINAVLAAMRSEAHDVMQALMADRA